MNRKLLWWPFKPPHRHHGYETGRRFVPGMLEQKREFEYKGFGFSDADQLLLGYTEITYKCSECGAYFINRHIGKIVDESKD